jgi:hypothetical protein
MSTKNELFERSARLVALAVRLKKQTRVLLQDGEALRKSSDELRLSNRESQKKIKESKKSRARHV